MEVKKHNLGEFIHDKYRSTNLIITPNKYINAAFMGVEIVSMSKWNIFQQVNQ